MPIGRDELENLYCGCRQQLFTCALVVTRSADLAEDAVHEAFCRILGHQCEVQNLKAYVFRAVRNAAVSQIRRKGATSSYVPESIFDPAPAPELAAEASEFQQQVVRLLETLSADERETVVQHLYGELTFQEIATVRERPLGTVTSWYRRGLEKLQRDLEVTRESV